MNNRIIFMGTPAFAVASLNALVEAGLEVVAVVTAPDRPAGRGRHLRMSAVKERALELGLPVLQPDKLKDPAFHTELDGYDASLYVVVAFRMLPEVVWRKPRHGTINLHASLLPDYRGAAPINWALINGETRTGVTTFFINEKIDTGDILLSETEPIHPDDDAGSLHDRLMATGADLLVRTVKGLLHAELSTMAQKVSDNDPLHEAPKLTPESCRIDWTMPAARIHDHIRGLSPYPGAWTNWTEGQAPPRKLKVLGSRPAKNPAQAAPGHVEIADGRMFVHCGEGTLEVLHLQMEGKRPMPTEAFLRGLQNKAEINLA